jgi:hypothetical protein
MQSRAWGEDSVVASRQLLYLRLRVWDWSAIHREDIDETLRSAHDVNGASLKLTSCARVQVFLSLEGMAMNTASVPAKAPQTKRLGLAAHSHPFGRTEEEKEERVFSGEGGERVLGLVTRVSVTSLPYTIPCYNVGLATGEQRTPSMPSHKHDVAQGAWKKHTLRKARNAKMTTVSLVLCYGVADEWNSGKEEIAGLISW